MFGDLSCVCRLKLCFLVFLCVFLGLSCIFQTYVVFFRPRMCFSFLPCVFQTLVFVFRPSVVVFSDLNGLFFQVSVVFFRP